MEINQDTLTDALGVRHAPADASVRIVSLVPSITELLFALGLGEQVLANIPPDRRLRIPMRTAARSLNLSNTVAIVVYEAWRQWGFAGTETGAAAP